ncbi:hypothetical protein [Paracoccus ravus]|uniref:hypothetical protein n=1 Tax=Paracoccus ravus TaxID=2447760 RepID=UPI001ADC3416|nr:hypothetical protein [Paracoccus ravus]
MSEELEIETELEEADGHADPAMPPEDWLPEDMMPEEGPEGAVEGPPPWRNCGALDSLRKQVNAAAPGRSKASDGTIGDALHRSRNSDHNPHIREGAMGVVSALDITHDPRNGCDAGRLIAALHASRDPRIKYLIWNRRIANSSAIGNAAPWTWRAYTGRNPHSKHCHISVKATKAHYDDAKPWAIGALGSVESVEIAEDIPDEETLVRNALAALGAGATEGPVLRDLLAAQDALTELLARNARQPRADDPEMVEAAPSPAELGDEYNRLWQSCQIRQERRGEVAWHVNRLLHGRPRYEVVAAKTRAPWWFIGIVHALEASFSFTGHLHNGDPLSARTVQVPRGRPVTWSPPNDWQSSAVDAITQSGHANQSDWSIPRTLYRFEAYNGFGYRRRGIFSPYLWSFSNHYSKGKYVADGRYSPTAVSRQCGAAVMLKALVNNGIAQV